MAVLGCRVLSGPWLSEGLGWAGSLGVVLGFLVDVVQLVLCGLFGQLAGLHICHLGGVGGLLPGVVRFELLGLVGQMLGLHCGHGRGVLGLITSLVVFIEESHTIWVGLVFCYTGYQ